MPGLIRREYTTDHNRLNQPTVSAPRSVGTPQRRTGFAIQWIAPRVNIGDIHIPEAGYLTSPIVAAHILQGHCWNRKVMVLLARSRTLGIWIMEVVRSLICVLVPPLSRRVCMWYRRPSHFRGEPAGTMIKRTPRRPERPRRAVRPVHAAAECEARSSPADEAAPLWRHLPWVAPRGRRWAPVLR